MELRRHADAASFLAAAGDYLAARLRDEGALWGHDPYLATVHEAGWIAAALRTPPFRVVLSETEREPAVDLLADDLAGVDLPGALGSKAASRRFARRFASANGRRAALGLEGRILRAESTTQPAGVPGAMRRAVIGDRALLVGWMQAFADEATPGRPGRSAAETVDERLRATGDGALFVWEDEGRPVSVAGSAGPTRHGIRVGPVYTPPELRGRGYASALTAALTEELLREGRRFCFLFTDLANPVSNRIYQRIGSRPVTDADEWRFV